ncbi:MAG: hypothetical protein QNK37_28095 [Acidobacteriota bacterium]|nr:hypothetical protein [Acidobacteriota bacterium]
MVEQLWKLVESDHHILLDAPRRSGKTSVMMRMVDQPQSPFQPVFISVESCKTVDAFFVDLIDKCHKAPGLCRTLEKWGYKSKRFLGTLRKQVDHVRVGEAEIVLTQIETSSWINGSVVERLLCIQEPRPLIMIDEIADFVQALHDKDPEEATKFLGWFREVRLSSECRAMFLLASSVHFGYTLESLGIDEHLNDLHLETVPTYDEPTTREYLKRTFSAKGSPISPEIMEALIERFVPTYPFTLARFVHDFFRHKKAFTAAEAIRIFKGTFLKNRQNSMYHQMDRINEHYGNDIEPAFAILNHLAVSRTPKPMRALKGIYQKKRAELGPDKAGRLLSRLLDRMEHEYYLIEEEKGYVFRDPVFRYWWVRHFHLEPVE